MGTLLAAPNLPRDLARDVSLAPFTTIRVGGPADALSVARSFRDVTAALAWARDEDMPVAVVGKGSNLLVDDAGYRGLVIRLAGRLTAIVVRGTEVWCGGGASLPRAVQRAAAAGLRGLEFGASIPGTAGGAVAMNAGAYGTELKDILEWAVVCDADGRRRVSAADLDMTYRHTSVRQDQVVAAAAFRLAPGDPEAIRALLAEYRGHRRSTQPQGVRTFGSVFTNPPGGSSGRLLEAAGCKGLRIGDARFSPKHANFIEAGPACSTADVIALMAEGRRRVREAGGPLLHAEVRYLHPRWGITAPPLPELS
ncbi:MAG: UDP-N-acetylmuramate dehydrogenase [Thermoleophilia bacterium]|nr:UDP-N-acetylmuramate dehydrogenase [Thermoleophilia bacterium]